MEILRNSAYFSGSDKPRMLYFLLINGKMPTIVGIYEQEKFYGQLSWAGKTFYNLRPDLDQTAPKGQFYLGLHCFMIFLCPNTSGHCDKTGSKDGRMTCPCQDIWADDSESLCALELHLGLRSRLKQDLNSGQLKQ